MSLKDESASTGCMRIALFHAFALVSAASVYAGVKEQSAAFFGVAVFCGFLAVFFAVQT